MDYQQMLDELYARERTTYVLGLKSTRELLKRLGNPETQLKYIHVAGTNGKGSTCSFISSILIGHGYKTGLYTSPHLIDFTERFKIDNTNITHEKLAELYGKVRPHITNQSFFEIITVMAFLWFQEERCDYVVLEVGLGGRLDATNVIVPEVAVITSLSVDHAEYLGKTLESIAKEKAGIIKKGSYVVICEENKGKTIIAEACRKEKAFLSTVKKMKRLKLGMKGQFQQENANLAVKSVELLFKREKREMSLKALKKALKETLWPGRFQYLQKNILLDCAHNVGGIEALSQELKGIAKGKRIICLMGVSSDKDYKRMIELLERYVSLFFFSEAESPRALPAKKMLMYYTAKQYSNKDRAKSLETSEYKTLIAGLTDNDLLLVTGSIYFVGHFLRHYN